MFFSLKWYENVCFKFAWERPRECREKGKKLKGIRAQLKKPDTELGTPPRLEWSALQRSPTGYLFPLHILSI
ncbi:hypothetical protein NHP190002_07430 [Helicobacter ailurogastricus]|nr:hypothetical protein NHP190002_07430 [Helicobacter ailurogastricus]